MVTLKQIAAEAGVSTYTVSCALNGTGAVGEETRARVKAVAAEMGYERDAAAALMAGRRVRGRTGERRMLLGVLGQNSEQEMRRWAAIRADGFELVFHPLPAMERLEATLRAWWYQGMEGLILDARIKGQRTWIDRAMAQNAAMAKFAVVTLGPSGFSHVRDSPVRMMDTVLHRVLAGGYRRVAVLLGENDQLSDNRARLGAALVAREEAATAGVALEIRRFALPTQSFPPEVIDWLKTYQPDAVVVFPGGHCWQLVEAGFRMPEDFACFGLPVDKTQLASGYDLSGMLVKTSDRLRAAMELMEQLLKLRLRGVPEHPLVRVIDAEWRVGKSGAERAG